MNKLEIEQSLRHVIIREIHVVAKKGSSKGDAIREAAILALHKRHYVRLFVNGQCQIFDPTEVISIMSSALAEKESPE